MSDKEYFGVVPSNTRDTENRYDYTATGGRSVFPATYQVGYVDVYRNGLHLDPRTQFTAINGSSIVVPGLNDGDLLSIVARRQVITHQGDLITLLSSDLTPAAGWDDVPGLHTPSTGDEITNAQAQALLNRTEYLLANGGGGSAGLSGYLTGDALIVHANADGTVSDWAGVGGVFHVAQGAEDKTTSSTFSVVNADGTNIAIGPNNGVYSISSMTGTTAHPRLRAEFGALFVEKVLTVTKVSGGIQGTPGVSPIYGYLDNSTSQVSATSDGYLKNSGDLATSGGVFHVFEGIVEKTGDSVSYSLYGTATGMTVRIDHLGVYTVDTLTADTGTCTFKAVYGGVTIYQDYVITKVRDGAAGASAQVLTLQSTSQSFTFDSTGEASPVTQAITFSANTQNLSGEATFTCSLYDAASPPNLIKTVTLVNAGTDLRTLPLSGTDGFGTADHAVVTATLGGHSDQVTVYRLADGIDGKDPVVGYLTNESVTLASDYHGVVDPTVYSTASTGSFKVYKGTQDNTANATFSVDSVSTGLSITLYTVTSGGNTKGDYVVTGMTSDTGYAVLKAVFGSVTLYKTLSVSKSRAGIPGTDAKILYLSATSQAFTFSSLGTLFPTTQAISFTANLQNLSGTATFSCTAYDASNSAIGSAFALSGSGNTQTLTSAAFGNAAYVVVTASLTSGGATVTDHMTVVKLKDGAPGEGSVSGYLTNEAVTVPASSDGVVLSGDLDLLGDGTFEVYDGTARVTRLTTTVSGVTTANVTYSVLNSAGITAQISHSGSNIGDYTVSNMVADSATATFRAVYGGITLDKQYTIVKARAGVAGSNAKVLVLSCTAQAFTFSSADVATPTGQTITFTASAQNLPTTITYVCTKFSGSTNLGSVTLGGTVGSATRTLDVTAFPSTLTHVTVVASVVDGSTTYSDQVTIAKLKDGAPGQGTVSGYLTNEAAIVPATSAGVVSSGDFTTLAGGQFKVFDASTDVSLSSLVAYSVVTSPAPIGVSISLDDGSVTPANKGKYIITGMSQDTGTAVLRAVYKGFTIDKQYTLVKSKVGVDGKPAKMIALACTAQTFTFNSSGTLAPAGQVIKFTANTQNALGATLSWDCKRYNASRTLIDTVATDAVSGDANSRTLSAATFGAAAYAVVTATLTFADSTTLSDYATIVAVKDGASSVTGYLTNESATIPATSAGVVNPADYVGAKGTFKVFDGLTEQTAAAVFDVVVSDGITVTFNPTSASPGSALRADYVVAGMTKDLATATLRAVYNGVTVLQTLTVTKARAGVDARDAKLLFLSSSAQAFIFAGDGTASPASQTITFNANLQNLSGAATWTCVRYDSTGTTLTSNGELSGTDPNVRTLTSAKFGAAAYAVVTASLGGLTDTETVFKLSAGAAGVTPVLGYLTNEVATVAADSTGAVASSSVLSDASSGFFKLYEGLVDRSASAAYSISNPSTGFNMTISPTGAYHATSMSADTGTATLVATYGGKAYSKDFSISKSRAGADGVNSKTLTLSASSQIFSYDGAGALAPATQSVAFIANLQNLTGSVRFYKTSYDAAGLAGTKTLMSTSADGTWTLSSTSFAAVVSPQVGPISRVVITAENGAYSDTVTVVRVVAGAKGTDAITGYLTNESVVLAADSSGNVSSGELTKAGGAFKILEGVDEVSPSSITFGTSSVPSSVAIGFDSFGRYSVTRFDASATSAVIRLTALYKGVTIGKDLSLVKSLAAVPGNPGADAKLLILSQDVFVLASTADSTPAWVGGTPAYVNFSASFPNGDLTGVTWTAVGTNSSGANTTLTLSDMSTPTAGKKRLATSGLLAYKSVSVSISAPGGFSDKVTVSVVTNGAKGDPGASTAGTPGPRGPTSISKEITGSVWSDGEAVSALSSAGLGAPILLDRVTLVNRSIPYVETRFYSGPGTGWIVANEYIDGNLLVDKTIGAGKIVTTDLAAISANLGTITAGTLDVDTIIAGILNGATGTFSGTLTADAVNAVRTLNIADNAVTLVSALTFNVTQNTVHRERFYIPAKGEVSLFIVAIPHGSFSGDERSNWWMDGSTGAVGYQLNRKTDRNTDGTGILAGVPSSGVASRFIVNPASPTTQTGVTMSFWELEFGTYMSNVSPDNSGATPYFQFNVLLLRTFK